MNQTGCQIEYVKCFKCKKNTVPIRKYYDRHLSEWISTDYRVCDECLRNGGKNEHRNENL